MIRSVLVFALALAATCNRAAASDGDQRSHRYYPFVQIGESPSEPVTERAFEIDVDGKRWWRGHSPVNMSLCDESDAMFCFHTPGFYFAVPKSLSAVGQEWVRDGRKFKSTGSERILISGTLIDVFVVTGDPSFDDTKDTVYYYSLTRGLVAMWSPPAPGMQPRLYMSATGYGFPVDGCVNSCQPHEFYGDQL